MKRLFLSLVLVASVSACDKPAAEPEAPTETATPELKSADEQPASAPVEASPEGDQAAAQKKAALPDDIQAGETKLYGDRFTVIEPPVTLATAMKTAGDHAGPYKVEATIQKVCKNKGCWFTMTDESIEQDVRVRMKDYGFFVPRNAEGTKAVVEGTLASREMPQEEAQHYADDAVKAGEAPEKVEGPQKVWEFTATSIELTKGEG